MPAGKPNRDEASSIGSVEVSTEPIVPGERPPGMIGGESTADLVRAAREDDRVQAIMLRVDSPGGDSYSSELIRRELAQAREQGKPVVVSMGDVAASGGYWISMASDEIWAEPTTITGSIGIYGLLVTVPETLAKLGIGIDERQLRDGRADNGAERIEDRREGSAPYGLQRCNVRGCERANGEHARSMVDGVLASIPTVSHSR